MFRVKRLCFNLRKRRFYIAKTKTLYLENEDFINKNKVFSLHKKNILFFKLRFILKLPQYSIKFLKSDQKSLETLQYNLKNRSLFFLSTKKTLIFQKNIQRKINAL